MRDEYINISGNKIEAGSLIGDKAKEIITAINYLNYFNLVECIKKENDEVIVVDIDIQRPQKILFDIRYKERIAIWCFTDNTKIPKVIPMRVKFPRLPHCNYEIGEYSLSICLDNRISDEILLTWCARYYLEDIRRWFKETALSKLHKENQILEPFWFDSEVKLLLPRDTTQNFFYCVEPISTNGRILTFGLKQVSDISKAESIVIFINAGPFTHGIINNIPTNLKALYDTLVSYDINIYEHIQNKLNELNQNKYDIKYIYKLKLILCLNISLKREDEGQAERETNYAFKTIDDIKFIAHKLNIWDTEKFDKPAGLLNQEIGKYANEANIIGINIIKPFTIEMARDLAGKTEIKDKSVAVIGLGALGSQIYYNLIRMGLYTWLLIDNDLLYPHNLSRHALDSYSLGYPKVNVLAYSANILLNDNISKPMVSNIINDGDAGLTEINRYDVILNFSASRAVSRYLSNNNILIKRCISSFINQMGTDLIILVEDLKRNVKLDSLEMQYYRYVANEPLLQNHFKANNVEVRYSTSCSDYSNRLPQDYMSMHAAIASHALPSIITDETPKILIWSANKEMAVKLYKDILVYPTKEIQCGVWKIKYDDGLIDCIYKYRNRKLPNETGGVLVGSYDMFRKIIYVVDTIKSPPDSEEWPNSYIRGCKGLQEKVKLIQVVTGGHLNYIGEWHSHPEGCGSDKSDLDDKALRSLASEINKNGVPALIMIAGNKYNFYLS